MRLFLGIVLVALAVVALSCGDSNTAPPDPIPGWLVVRITSPNSDDGGVVFTVSGPGISSVRSTHPDLYYVRPDSISMRVVVGGDLTSGSVVAEIQVPDVQAVRSYTAALQQVAARESYQQRSLSGYSLAVEQ